MKLNYYPDTDSLYIDLSEQPSIESREVAEGIVLDYDAKGHLVGIDIDHASQKVEETAHAPAPAADCADHFRLTWRFRPIACSGG